MAKRKKSRWGTESKDGRFVIECRHDGCLIVVDCDRMDPEDEDSMDGILCIQPEDSEAFLSVMKTAVDLAAARAEAKAQAKAARALAKAPPPGIVEAKNPAKPVVPKKPGKPKASPKRG